MEIGTNLGLVIVFVAFIASMAFLFWFGSK